MVSSSIRLDSLIKKFKEAGGTVREITYEQSPRLSPLWLSASSFACHGLLIITVITPLPTKPKGDKNARATEAGERGNYRHAMPGVMLPRSMQNGYLKELADASRK